MQSEMTTEQVITGSRIIALLREFSKLPPAQQTVLKLRYGFDMAPYSMEQTGRILKVTRERVRQIEGKAITQLQKAFER